MEFFDVIKKRRSIRKYKDLPVEKEDILKILDAANWAPSAMNLQPWEFIVVSGELLKPLGNTYKNVVKEFTQELDDDNEIISNNDFIKYAGNFGGAPVIIVVLTRKVDDHNEKKANIESASAAMENLILAATDIGLGTCWMTGPLRNEKDLRHILDIPSDREIIALTPLGYPEEIPNSIPRIDPELKQKIKWLK